MGILNMIGWYMCLFKMGGGNMNDVTDVFTCKLGWSLEILQYKL